MEIAEAKTLTADELAIDDKAAAEAETAAAGAAELHASLKRQAVEGPALDKSKAVPVVEAGQIAEFHRDRADRIRAQASRAAAAKRLLALQAVGTDVQKVAAAAADDGPIAAAIAKIADGASELKRLCADHDTLVTALMARAGALGAEPPAPSGPRASSAHVAVIRGGTRGPSGIAVGRTTALLTSGRVKQAIVAAAAGDPDAAVAHLGAVRKQAEPKRADHYYRAGSGRIITSDDPVPSAILGQLRNGALRELGEDEISAHLAGRLDGHRAQA